mmetsp:Transcript_13167/g.31418  ORF Transcript_13167/g.31418 Transcript_13167/m.31418 type:complete len:1848 (-) Transcript_13167:281-5824(-)
MLSPLLHPTLLDEPTPTILSNLPLPPTTTEKTEIISQLEESSHQTFAATSATKEEEEIARRGVLPDGTKPVQVAKRIWRAKAKNTYIEPATELNDNMNWLFEDLGRTVAKERNPVTPRDDVIEYKEETYGKEFESQIQWRDCPTTWKPIFEAVIKSYWDVFAKEGMKRPILGYEFSIDTGEAKPTCCRQPRYGPHESRVMNKLVNELEKKGLIEDDQGPWGSQVVLASKPNQGHVHWSEYVFRLCVSYRQLNSITRPFQFYILRCDDAVETVGDAKFFITMDLDAGYWQVKLHEDSKERTAFFTPDGKKHWLVMPMGILNAHAFFVCMTVNFKKEWQALYKEDPKQAMDKLTAIINEHKAAIEAILGKEAVKDIHAKMTAALLETDPNASVIVDDVLLFDNNIISLIAYFVTVLETLKKYRVTVNLRKTRFLPPRAEFVGRDLLPTGNSPAQSKYGTIRKLCPPASFSDIQMLNGLFGYYAPWIPLLELEIKRWREYVKQKPLQGECTEEEIKTKVTKLKTDWSSEAMGAVLLQADITEEAEEAMLKEINGEKCEFDKAISGLRLRPIAFISRICKGKEKDYHSYVGEAATGLWAMRKFRQWLVGREFTWISDCSGLTKFFEGTSDITHTIQRWRLELLSLNFTIVHRPARMLVECDLMSRYQGIVESWREQQDSTHTTSPIVAASYQFNKPTPSWPIQHHIPTIVGTPHHNSIDRTELAKICDSARATWIIGADMDTFTPAYERLGGKTFITARTSEKPYWQEQYDVPNIANFTDRLTRQVPPVEWLVIHDMAQFLPKKTSHLTNVIEQAVRKGAQQVVLTWYGQARSTIIKPWETLMRKLTKDDTNMATTVQFVTGDQSKAHINTPHTFILTANKSVTRAWNKVLRNIQNDQYAQPRTIEEILDPPNDNYNGYVSMTQIRDKTVEIPQGQHNDTVTHSIQDIFQPAQHIRPTSKQSHIIIQTTDGQAPADVRALRPREHIALLGFDHDESHEILKNSRKNQHELLQTVHTTVPIATWLQLLTCTFIKVNKRAKIQAKTEATTLMFYTKNESDAKQHLSALTHKSINRFTTLPIPTGEEWKEYCMKDHYIQIIMTAIQQKKEPQFDRLQDVTYLKEFKYDRLESENGILYQLEHSTKRIMRQLRRAVVPERLRPTIIAAYHSTPLAGHVGFHKTLYRIAARFWWPKMTKDIREAVLSCGHCTLGNATNHVRQKLYQPTSIAEPFEVCCMDIWFPGKCKTFRRNASPALLKTLDNKAVITYLCNTTGFATIAFISSIDSNNMARIAFSQFFTIRGMPRLILIDDGSENKGDLTTICQILGLSHHTVSAESHDGILNERFHRYLNKVQKLGATDLRTYDQWAMNSVFATYGWNASPVDGTDIQRAFAALYKHFNFPMDTATQEITEPPLKRRRTDSGAEATARIEIMFPLWWRQKELLKQLVDERREHHRNLKNKLRTQRKFYPGDIVVVRKQVQSNAVEGIPAKLVLKTKGPYRVIEQASPDSYRLQKIPGTSTLLRTKASVPIKESAFRLTRIPSTIIIHKRVDTPDTRLASIGIKQPLFHSPLEQQLGLVDFGKYAKAATDVPYAFDKIQSLWGGDEDEEEEKTNQEEPAEATTNAEEELQDQQEPSIPTQVQQAMQLAPSRPINATPPTTTDTNNSTEEPPPTTKPSNITTRETLPRKLELLSLYERIKASKHKLFAIAQEEEHQPLRAWYIVQVDIEETNEELAKSIGQYHCRWHIPKPPNSNPTTSITTWKFWPLVKEFTSDGTYGDTKYVSPNKVERYLHQNYTRYAWYQKEINLAEDGIEGPFEFDKGLLIPNKIWEAIRRIAAKRQIDITDIQSRGRRK